MDLNVFSINLFSIKNFETFFDEVKKEYKYISIQENGFENFELYNYVKTNFDIVKNHFSNEYIFYNNGLRDIIKFLYDGGFINRLDNFTLEIIILYIN